MMVQFLEAISGLQQITVIMLDIAETLINFADVIQVLPPGNVHYLLALGQSAPVWQAQDRTGKSAVFTNILCRSGINQVHYGIFP